MICIAVDPIRMYEDSETVCTSDLVVDPLELSCRVSLNIVGNLDLSGELCHLCAEFILAHNVGALSEEGAR